MGKLIASVHASTMEKLTKPHWFRRGQKKAERQAIPIKLLVRVDPSDAKYEYIDGKKRRKPETLPAHRRHDRLDASVRQLKETVKEATTKKAVKKRKAA